jgi:hypothetical protein
VRWDFPDSADVEESRERERVTAEMDRWWQAFASRAEQIDAHFTKGREFDLVAFMNGSLDPVSDGLSWEFGPAVRKEGHRLVITPEGKHELQPLLRELLRRAPRLPRWEFYPGRLPEKPEVAFAVAEQIARFKASDVRVQVSLGEFRRVDLQFHIANARGRHDAALNYAFRAAEQMLGEAVLDNWIGVIDLAPPQSIVKRLFGGKPAGLVAPERLKPTVDALIAASRDQLPDPPPRVRAQQNRDDVGWTSFGLKPDEQDDYAGRDDLFFVATCEPELFQAAMNDRVFHSPRFSRTGETFAYLKLDRGGDESRGVEPIDSADARGAIEDAVNATLGEHGLGCTTGGGTGVMYAYVDVALTDVRRAIPVLRDLLRRRRVHQRAWLLFFDPELAEEWIGIHDDTPPPPNRGTEE